MEKFLFHPHGRSVSIQSGCSLCHGRGGKTDADNGICPHLPGLLFHPTGDSPRDSSGSSVYPLSSPPKIFFSPARKSFPVCLARMVLPETMPECPTIFLPGRDSAVERSIRHPGVYFKKRNPEFYIRQTCGI